MWRAPGAFSMAISRPMIDVEHNAPNRLAASLIRARLAGFSTPSARSVSVKRGSTEVALQQPLLALHVRAFWHHARRAGGVRAGARGAQVRGLGRTRA